MCLVIHKWFIKWGSFYYHFCYFVIGNVYIVVIDMNSYEKVTTSNKPIRVRFSKGPAAAQLAYMADEKGFAHIQVSNYELSFLSSTIDKLAPLFADEKPGEPLPMLIEVSDFDFTLKVLHCLYIS